MTDLNRRTVLGALGAAATLPLVPGMARAQDGPLKVGFVYIGPVGDFGWSYQHDQGRHLGNISVWHTSRQSRVGEVGYWVRSDEYGRGIATEAAARVLEVAFGTLGLHRVTLRIAVASGFTLRTTLPTTTTSGRTRSRFSAR